MSSLDTIGLTSGGNGNFNSKHNNVFINGTFTLSPNAVEGYVLTAQNSAGLATWEPSSSVSSVTQNNATYAQIGSGPGTVAAGQPMTYGTQVSPANPNFVLTTGVFTPFTSSGSTIQILVAGTYLVSFQQNSQANGGVVLYYGASRAAMLPLAYSMAGAQTATCVTSGTFPVYAAAGSYLAVCAAAGNAAALNPYANSSTTNASSTSVMILQIA